MALDIWAPTLPAFFDEATRALFDVMVDVVTIAPSERVPIVVGDALDADDLLVRFLSELHFLHDARGWLFRGFEAREVAERAIEGDALGERLDPERHAILRQVKAVTHHQAALRRVGEGWKGSVVLDL